MTGSRLVIAALICLGSGCAARHPASTSASPDSAAVEPRTAEVVITVRNHHWLDMTVYLIRGGHPERLGTAPGLSTHTLLLPWRRVEARGEIRLAADPVGQSRGIVTDYVVVRPGSIVEWTIESDLAQSSIAVY